MAVDCSLLQKLIMTTFCSIIFSFDRSIINPADGEKHDVLDLKLTLGPEEEVLLDGKSIAVYFSELREKEKTLILAANKRGEAAEIYRENLMLKKRLKDVTFERDQWKAATEAVAGKEAVVEILPSMEVKSWPLGAQVPRLSDVEAITAYVATSLSMKVSPASKQLRVMKDKASISAVDLAIMVLLRLMVL